MTMLDDDVAPSRKWHFGFGGFLLRDWPYVLMLILSLGGVAYTSFAQSELYWVLLTPLIGLVCVITRWSQVEGRDEHVHLVVTQALHWGAVLVAMQLMSLQVLRQVTGIASPLSVLTLLALGTFTAGLHIRSWKVCVVGAILAVGVPAVALLQQSALLILLITAVLVAIVVPFVWARSRASVGPAHPLYEKPASAAYEPPVTAPAAAPLSQTPLFDPPVETPAGPQPAMFARALDRSPGAASTAKASVADDFDPSNEPITMQPGIDPATSEPVTVAPREPHSDEPESSDRASDNVRNIFGGR